MGRNGDAGGDEGLVVGVCGEGFAAMECGKG